MASNASDRRYRDEYGRIEWISEMTGSEIAEEINIRLSLLENEGYPISEADADPRVETLFGTKYQVNQILFLPSTAIRKKHFSVVLISIPHANKVMLDFEQEYNMISKEWTSFAHTFLQKLRNMCDNLELLTLSERQHVQNQQLDQMYDQYICCD